MSSAEFAANNAVNVSTGYSPFYLQVGDNPIVPSTFLNKGAGSRDSRMEAIQEMVDRMKTALEDAQQNLATAQQRIKTYVDRSRRDETFRVGTEVVLNTRNLQQLDKHLPLKLCRRWIGPFKVEKVVSLVAYRLNLPPSWKIWPVFHVSNLKRFRRSNEFVREDQPLPPILVDGEEEYEVDGDSSA